MLHHGSKVQLMLFSPWIVCVLRSCDSQEASKEEILTVFMKEKSEILPVGMGMQA